MSQEILKSQLNTNMYGTCHNIVPLGVVFIQHLNLRQPTERYSSVFFCVRTLLFRTCKPTGLVWALAIKGSLKYLEKPVSLLSTSGSALGHYTEPQIASDGETSTLHVNLYKCSYLHQWSFALQADDCPLDTGGLGHYFTVLLTPRF